MTFDVRTLLRRSWVRVQERRAPRGGAPRGSMAGRSRSFSTMHTTLIDPTPLGALNPHNPSIGSLAFGAATAPPGTSRATARASRVERERRAPDGGPGRRRSLGRLHRLPDVDPGGGREGQGGARLRGEERQEQRVVRPRQPQGGRGEGAGGRRPGRRAGDAREPVVVFSKDAPRWTSAPTAA
nr:uncharacterized protein LOC113813975 [Penaeus vannamei]